MGWMCDEISVDEDERKGQINEDIKLCVVLG